MTSTHFNVTIIDDGVLEFDEQFSLTIDSLPSRVTSITPSQTTITILNDDSK